MRRALLLWGAVLSLLGSFTCNAAEFSFDVAKPKFSVILPGIPQMAMGTHPMNATQPHLRYQGSEGPYTVSVFTPAAAAGMTPLECASATVRTLAARAGVPPAAQIYKARLNDTTYVAIYAETLPGGAHLHAHFLSAAGGTHCIEVHASRISTSDDDLAPWFEDSMKGSIKPD